MRDLCALHEEEEDTHKKDKAEVLARVAEAQVKKLGVSMSVANNGGKSTAGKGR